MNITVETLGISKVDFMGNNLMFLHLSNERTVLVLLTNSSPLQNLHLNSGLILRS